MLFLPTPLATVILVWYKRQAMPELLTLAEVERRHIILVLRATGGNKTKAADVLGVDRRTLYRHIRSDKSLRDEFLVNVRPITRAQIAARIEALKEQLAASAE